jgi:hypothetical protein
MARDGEEKAHADHPMSPLGHELAMHIERAHELGERAKRANGNAQHEIDRAREIANALSDEFAHGSSRRSKR